jgi:hypothetical protein
MKDDKPKCPECGEELVPVTIGILVPVPAPSSAPRDRASEYARDMASDAAKRSREAAKNGDYRNRN